MALGQEERAKKEIGEEGSNFPLFSVLQKNTHTHTAKTKTCIFSKKGKINGKHTHMQRMLLLLCLLTMCSVCNTLAHGDTMRITIISTTTREKGRRNYEDNQEKDFFTLAFLLPSLVSFLGKGEKGGKGKAPFNFTCIKNLKFMWKPRNNLREGRQRGTWLVEEDIYM